MASTKAQAQRPVTATPDELASIGKVLASLGPEQLRTMRALFRMLAEYSDDLVAREEIMAAVREALQPEGIGRIAPSVSVQNGSRERLRAYREHVGQQITRYRRAAGMTQAELAHRSGIPQSHISRLECGQYAPTFNTMNRIAQALKIEAKHLDPGFNH